MRRKTSFVMVMALLFSLLSACATSAPSAEGSQPSTTAASNDPARPAGWNEASHGNSVEPNYAVVFPEDRVNEVTITISPENWAAMQENMTELYGEPGRGGGPGGFGGFPPTGQGGGPGGFGIGPREKPMWVEATLSFNNETWMHVGVRYKGNSSLMSSWRSGSQKLPFKLDFDEFEDEYPEINNQRFYGFKQLSLANGFSDATYMRDAITYDLLEAAGLPAAKTAFYNITLDYGEGPVNLGIYTAIEVIDDTVIERVFGDDSGNIYEADGRAASLALNTFEQISESFQKENNEKEADWSDIEALHKVLHSELRTTDPDAWRAELEAIFDVDTFLEWLAISATIQHWDTYGGMSHNYYLYNDPATGKLTWISWDHNMVLGSGPGAWRGGEGWPRGDQQPPQGQRPPMDGQPPQGQPPRGPGRGMAGRGTVTFDKAEVTAEWPLIRYLLDQPTYMNKYLDYLREFTTEVYNPEQLAAQYQQWAELLRPYVAATDDIDAFDNAVMQLTTQTQARAQAAAEFLAKQN